MLVVVRSTRRRPRRRGLPRPSAGWPAARRRGRGHRHYSSINFLCRCLPRHHHPCRPHPLLHHRCRRSPATLVTIALSLAALFVAALIIGHALLLYVTPRCRARVHRPPSTLPSLVDCCIFTPAVATAVITVSAPPPQSSPPPQLLLSLTSSSMLPPLTLLPPP